MRWLDTALDLEHVGRCESLLRHREGKLRPAAALQSFRLLRLWCLFAALPTFNPQLSAAVFTTNITINEGDTTYDRQDIIVSNATVTINGAHSFNSILLTNSAVLTHSPNTTIATHKLDLTVTNQIAVSANSRIDVSGKGYAPGRTSGNVTNGAAPPYAGGSHGGWGGGSETE